MKDTQDDGTVIYEAIKVSLDTMRQRLIDENKKILACVHGFQVEPEYWVESCALIQDYEGFNQLVLPVIWPSIGVADGFLELNSKYDKEQTIAFQAGKVFGTIGEIGLETNLSLMCHR